MKIKMIIGGDTHQERISNLSKIKDYCNLYNEGGEKYSKDWFPSKCIFIGSDKIDIFKLTLSYTIDIELDDKEAYDNIRVYYYDMIIFCLCKISKDVRVEKFWHDIIYQFKGQTLTYKELWSLIINFDNDIDIMIEKFINYDKIKVRRKKLKKLNKIK